MTPPKITPSKTAPLKTTPSKMNAPRIVVLSFLLAAVGAAWVVVAADTTAGTATRTAVGPGASGLAANPGASRPAAGAASAPASQPASVIVKKLPEMSLDLAGNVKIKFVLIPAGRFMMGSPSTEKSRETDEGPQRGITITKPFYMAVTPLTQQQYQAVTGQNPGAFVGPDNPVVNVSWHEATDYCKSLSQQTSKKVRLPTEAEWEYACRAGGATRYFFGDDDKQLGDYAWYQRNSEQKTHPVAGKKPNAWGLYDMHGNVWEMCQDWYDDGYKDAKTADPTGPKASPNAINTRVMRGGSWSSTAVSCRSAARYYIWHTSQMDSVGFRVVMDVK